MSHDSPFNALSASRVARAMEGAGLSDEQIADRALLERDQIERILAGTEPISLDTVVLLAGALEISSEALLKDIEWVPDGQGGSKDRMVDSDG